MRDVVETYPSTFIRNYRGLAVMQSYFRKPVDREVKVYVLSGETDLGKSRWARHHYGGSLHSVSEPEAGQQYWFDGYTDQSAILFDDFSGAVGITRLLKWLDRYPVDLPVKGGFVEAKYTTVIITCNGSIDDWYPVGPVGARTSHVAALKRRITATLDVKEPIVFELSEGVMKCEYDRELNLILEL